MRYFKTFESFLNESSFKITSDPFGLKIEEPNKSEPFYTGPTFVWDSKKGGIVESYEGSHGTETRIIIKCTEDKGTAVLAKVAEEFKNPQSTDYNSYYKKVKDFIKKNV
jgi:glutamine amidotransferase-like uncharacterized protein